MADDKTEKASEQRKKKAREQGDIVKSRDLTSALGMAAGVFALGSVAQRFLWNWRAAYARCLDMGAHTDLSLEHGSVVNSLLRASMLPSLEVIGIVLASALGLALATGMAQTGGMQFHPEALQPKGDRLNPVSNIKNVFSLRSSTRLGKSLVPAAVVMILGAHWMERSVLSLPVLSLERIPAMFESQYQLLLASSGILLVWSALDYLIEWRSWEQRLKMSHQEMREEYKQTEGNPQVRGRIRSIRRQMRNRKLRADVSNATVVIVNPTHYAVALDFNFETMQAPKVLAKGRNLVAQQIKDEARWAGVPIIENPPLARSLFRSVEPGQAIPRDLYATVAAILAFLYRQQSEEKARAAERDQRQHRSNGSEAAPTPQPWGLPTTPMQSANISEVEDPADSPDVVDAIWDEEDMSDEEENV
jgi:flagellar biosynthetic protein FlhB